MSYQKPTIEDLRKEPVFAGACGDYGFSCGAAVHQKGATGACGDYGFSCGAKVHMKSATGACGDYGFSCGAKVHMKG